MGELALDFFGRNPGTDKAMEQDLLDILENVPVTSRPFDRKEQHDAQEFLQRLLDRLRFEQDGPGIRIEKLFDGRVFRQTTCAQCNTPGHALGERFNMLQVGVAFKTVQDALDKELQKPEILGRGQNYHCTTCQDWTPRAWRQTTLLEAPPVLVLHLRRFDSRQRKLSDRIHVKQTIYVQEGADKRSVEYMLYGIVKHRGDTIKSGHYVASVLGPNQRWYEFNDTWRERVTLEKARSYSDGGTPYILFYERLYNR